MTHDLTHDMYLPDRRALKGRRRIVPISELVMPPRNGAREEKEAWMRERQAAKLAREQRKQQAKEYNPNRHANTVLGAIMRKHGIDPCVKAPAPVFDPSQPDLSGEWAI